VADYPAKKMTQKKPEDEAWAVRRARGGHTSDLQGVWLRAQTLKTGGAKEKKERLPEPSHKSYSPHSFEKIDAKLGRAFEHGVSEGRNLRTVL